MNLVTTTLCDGNITSDAWIIFYKGSMRGVLSRVISPHVNLYLVVYAYDSIIQPEKGSSPFTEWDSVVDWLETRLSLSS